MYLGTYSWRPASSDELYEQSGASLYTRLSLSAIPIPNPEQERSKKVLPLEGEVGSPINCGPGCRFASRCKFATEKCKSETPKLKEIKAGHFVACHLFDNSVKVI